MSDSPMMSGLGALDSNVSRAAQAIQSMPLPQAQLYLMQHNIPYQTAQAIIQNMVLKQHAALNAPQGQPGQQPPVTQKLNNATMQAVQQIAADNARRGGISQLPVPEDMFGKATNDPHQGMAGGGIVAFADGGEAHFERGGGVYGTPITVPSGGPGLGALLPSWSTPDPKSSDLAYAYANPDAPISKQILAKYNVPSTPAAAPSPAAPVVPAALDDGPKINLANSSQTVGGAPRSGTPAPLPTDQSSIVRASVSGSGPSTGADRAEALAQKQKEEADANLAKFTPQSLTQHFDNLWGIAQSQGIGEASKTHLVELDNMKDQFGKLKSQNNWLALSQAGFAMAQAATQNPHGGFLGALAVGGAKGAEQFGANLKDYRDAMAKVNEQRYLMAQQQENVKSGFITLAAGQQDKDFARYENLAGRQFAAQDRVIATIAGKEVQSDISRANIMAAKAGAGYKGSGADRLMGQYLEQHSNDPLDVKIATLGKIQQQTASYQGTAGRNATALTAIQQKALAMDDRYKMGNDYISAGIAQGDQEMVQRGQQLVQQAQESVAGITPVVAGSGVGVVDWAHLK